ncbi:putative poly(A) polymerase [Butyriboletus roseoflavus]|nr:putative poly(A) polymerase [Butyriboletus roseoflavus]
MFYLNKGKKGHRDKFFDLSHGEEGGPADRPLIIQFCANDPEQLLESARVLQDHCDAIDLNLGCPQEIARSGRYGAFLMDDWNLIYKLINTLHRELKVPVTAKFRVFPTAEKTVEYARMLERAGAQILTCHGRLREQRGQHTGLADWAKIRAVKEAVSVPVFANGNILFHSDIERCLAETGADAVMSAEGQLYDPALFASASSSDGNGADTRERLVPGTKHTFDTGVHLAHADLALEYLEIVQGLQTPTSLSAVKGHLFKLLRPALARETDLRDELSSVRGPRSLERYLGVTAPISTAESTEREKEVTATLMEELRNQKTFESVEEARTRESVLGHVAALVKKFVYQVSLKRGLSEAAAIAAGGKIFTFGSYRLGVHGPASDIDTLCVVPKHVSREDFFDVFEGLLREMEGVTEVSGVPEAYVPIIKTKISGIPLDFLMARLALSSIPDDLSLKDDNLLRNLDERCVRSLNGSRVNDEILRLVPNVQVYRDSLRCIKLWAQRRAIYSNVNGFFGGVAWAILVARVCQLYPNAIAGAIVSRFFIIMYQWSWPQPVLLKQIEEGPLQVRVWNPKLYPADRSHRMPIITPAYPAMCATHNVTASTQMIVTEEFKKGADIVDRVIVGTASWSELFAKHDFFHKYRYYLQVTASTGESELQIKWAGTVESRIRQLVMKLEYVDSLILAHPFIKGFEQMSNCMSREEVCQVAQGQISDAIAKRTKADLEGIEDASTVYSTTFYIGLLVEPKPIGSVGPRKLDISYPTTEFTKLVKMWEKYDESQMGIFVRNIKSSALPDHVFDEGERQPRQALKRPKTGKGPGKSNHTSPDMPNKKRRSEMPVTTAPKDEDESGIPGLSLSPAPAPESLKERELASLPTERIIKTPQLPLHDSPALATGAVAAQ